MKKTAKFHILSDGIYADKKNKTKLLNYSLTIEIKENNLIYTLNGRRRDNFSFEDEETPDIVSCYSWLQFQDGHTLFKPTKQSTGRPDKKGNS